MTSPLALSKTESGFALLDMLIGLAVLGLLMSGLVASLSFVTKRQEALRTRAEMRESALAVKRLMHSLIDGAPVLSGLDQRPDLSGSDTAFSIHSIGPAVLALPELSLFEISAISNAGGIDLVVSWNDPQAQTERSRTIARGLAQASFDYLLRDPKQAKKGWRKTASDRAGRVEAVRLTLRSAETEPMIEIITPVRSEVAALCANPANTQTCRTRTP